MQRSRRRFIQDSVRGAVAYVAVVDHGIIGYAVLEYSFFSRGFIAMLYVHPDHRRSGIGTTRHGGVYSFTDFGRAVWRVERRIVKRYLAREIPGILVLKKS